MSYKIVDVCSDHISQLHLKEIENFCLKAETENKHAAATNMQATNWKNNNSSLLYLLLKEKRFNSDKGSLQLLYENNELVALSGFYQSDFDSDIYIMGVRSWVLKEHRFNLLIATQILPYQIAKIKERHGQAAVITFNETTRSFAKLIERSNKNPEAKLKFFFGENYPEIYKDMTLWPNPVRIKGVKQWILIKTLKSNTFDWSSINWSE